MLHFLMVNMGFLSLFLCVTASFFCLLYASDANHRYSSTLFGSERRVERAITTACEGDLYTALELIMTFNNIVPSNMASAGGLHIESALQYILHANVTAAVSLHKQAKLLNATLVPPLAALYLAQHMASESSQSPQTAACPGLGDMFYVSAVSIKQIADNHTQANVLLGSKTMITLLADSGLSRAAEAHYSAAIQAATTTAAGSPAATAADTKDPTVTATVSASTAAVSSLLFRGSVLIPAVYDHHNDIQSTRRTLHDRISRLVRDACVHGNATLDHLDEFTLSPTFYLVYQGHNDRHLLQQLRRAYSCAHPALASHESLHNEPIPHDIPHDIAQGNTHTQDILHDVVTQQVDHTDHKVVGKKIRVGFVSSHLRRHSICKLFCGLFMRLDRSRFEVVVFAALAESDHDGMTNAVLSGHGWMDAHNKGLETCQGSDKGSDKDKGSGQDKGSDKDKSSSQDKGKESCDNPHNAVEVESIVIGMTMVQNRVEVTRRRVDVLVYLDVGMEPSTVAWAMARLAPIQVVLWGHPVTTGVHPHMDYFISSDAYHIDRDGSAHTRAQSNPQSNHQSNSLSNSQSNHTDHDDFTDDVTDEFKDGYAQGWFTEPLVRMRSLGMSFDRASSLKVVQQALLAPAPGLAPAPEPGLGDKQALIDRMLIDRPDGYYHALTTQLTLAQTAQSKSQSKSQSKLQSNNSPRQERDNGRSWTLLELLQRKQVDHGTVRLIVCPQHLPKFHPMFDRAIKHMLFDSLNHPDISDVLFVVLAGSDKHHQWRRTLMRRWTSSLALTDKELSATFGSVDSAQTLPQDAPDPRLVLLTKIAWLPSLSPDEYALLLASGDLLVDPYPFGGGVTSLEALAVCTPVVTLPSLQTVPALTAGMLRQVFDAQSNSQSNAQSYITAPSQTSQSNPIAPSQTSQSNLTASHLIATNETDYVRIVVNLLASSSPLLSKDSTKSGDGVLPQGISLMDVRRSLCQSDPFTHAASVDVLFNSTESVREWETFLVRAAVTASGQPLQTNTQL